MLACTPASCPSTDWASWANRASACSRWAFSSCAHTHPVLRDRGRVHGDAPSKKAHLQPEQQHWLLHLVPGATPCQLLNTNKETSRRTNQLPTRQRTYLLGLHTRAVDLCMNPHCPQPATPNQLVHLEQLPQLIPLLLHHLQHVVQLVQLDLQGLLVLQLHSTCY